MLLIDPQERYADIMERQIYNSILSGVSLDGRNWFYTNPLRWYGREHHLLSNDAHERFKPGDPDRRRANVCCPTNVLRTIAEWHNYQYTTSKGGLWVHHYAANELDDATWELTLDTDYPWDGEITITIQAAPAGKSALMLRVPNWTAKPKLVINGEPSRVAKRPGTYARINHEWAAGDEVKLSLPMPTRLLEAHPKVEALRNQVAVQRGPLIYCLESPDLPEDVRVPEIQIPHNARFTPVHESDLLGGVTVLECEARRAPLGDWDGALYRPAAKTRGAKLTVRLIPYYVWANRGVSEMTVWMPVC